MHTKRDTVLSNSQKSKYTVIFMHRLRFKTESTQTVKGHSTLLSLMSFPYFPGAFRDIVICTVKFCIQLVSLINLYNSDTMKVCIIVERSK